MRIIRLLIILLLLCPVMINAYGTYNGRNPKEAKGISVYLYATISDGIMKDILLDDNKKTDNGFVLADTVSFPAAIVDSKSTSTRSCAGTDYKFRNRISADKKDLENKGDINADGKVTLDDVLDAVNLIMLLATPETMPEADVNGDGRISITDIQVIINRFSVEQ